MAQTSALVTYIIKSTIKGVCMCVLNLLVQECLMSIVHIGSVVTLGETAWVSTSSLLLPLPRLLACEVRIPSS